jgi:DNA-binding transcriptional LysR family regulator
MELRDLRTFRMVAQTLNFTQAAQQLDYAQSSITAQIQHLEAELGQPLFDRLGRKVILTEAGQQLLRYADKILELEAEARTLLTGQQEGRGTLTIGAPESICNYFLPPILAAFRQSMPQVRLILKQLFYTDLSRHLREGWLDLAFFIEDPLTSSQLHFEMLQTQPVHMIAAADHPLAGREQVTPHDLEGQTLILTERGCGYRNKFERVLATVGYRPTMALEFGSVETIKQCVMAGLGLGILPQMTLQASLQAGGLVCLPWSDPFEIYIQIGWHKDKWLSPILEQFIAQSRACAGA